MQTPDYLALIRACPDCAPVRVTHVRGKSRVKPGRLQVCGWKPISYGHSGLTYLRRWAGGLQWLVWPSLRGDRCILVTLRAPHAAAETLLALA